MSNSEVEKAIEDLRSHGVILGVSDNDMVSYRPTKDNYSKDEVNKLLKVLKENKPDALVILRYLKKDHLEYYEGLVIESYGLDDDQDVMVATGSDVFDECKDNVVIRLHDCPMSKNCPMWEVSEQDSALCAWSGRCFSIKEAASALYNSTYGIKA